MYDIRYILFDLPGLLRCYVWRNLRRYFPADSGQTSTQRNKKALHITYGISPPDVLASFNLIFQCSRLGCSFLSSASYLSFICASDSSPSPAEAPFFSAMN
ncbi:hypothetical protein WDD9_005234 [Paenibacillus melissococcoides]|uniref:hypothetical protein n=1 Tax=Paenibacillus melissococcoides TaxID=2912268 RepID=UPI0021C3D8AB|nr:hypothetical protein [Paenibacillus melissococcoides]CAH8718466.1 hypothetical protein WDD9_005234 [Paenibacillus melissococcoides]